MRSADRIEFVSILNGLAALKPNSKITPEALELWWQAMRDWSIDDFRSAASHLARTVEFMPNPYHFEQLRKAAEPNKGEAWAIAKQRCLSWRTPERIESDRISRAVAQVGGYRTIAMADEERALPHIERRFLQAYEELADVEVTRTALPELSHKQLENRKGSEAPTAPELNAMLRDATRGLQ
jgi:hypothetical protein